MIVAISSDGRYMINKTPVSGKTVDAMVLALGNAAKAGPESVIVISADASAAHQSVITVMEAARRAGLHHITFATQTSAQAARK